MSLHLPAEPDELRAELRRSVAERPADAHALVGRSLAGYLWSAWGDDLAPLPLVRRVVDGSRYESYLWVMGDRRWAQLVDTLAGRLERRRDHPAGRQAASGR